MRSSITTPSTLSGWIQTSRLILGGFNAMHGTHRLGHYLQNNYFDPANHPIQHGAYYPPAITVFDTSTVNNVEIDHVLGPDLTRDNPVKNPVITDSTLTNTNDDGVSIAGGHTILHNTIDNCTANGMESPVTEYAVSVSGNQVSNRILGINEIGLDVTDTHTTMG